MDDTALALKKNLPGPGAYEEVLKFKQDGRYINSTYSNSKASRLAMEPRFKEPLNAPKSPGPGYYE